MILQVEKRPRLPQEPEIRKEETFFFVLEKKVEKGGGETRNKCKEKVEEEMRGMANGVQEKLRKRKR